MKFDLPSKFNGTRLRNELSLIGIDLPLNNDAISIAENNLFIDIDDKDYDKVIEVLKNHNGNDIVIETTIEQKLASVGLSIDDLKSALGLQHKL